MQTIAYKLQGETVFISLKVESLQINSNWSDKSFKNAAPNATAIAMNVSPLNRTQISLSTGEVFRNPRRGMPSEDKPNIEASIYIIATNDPERYSNMVYLAGSESDYGVTNSSIHFDLAIDPAAFDDALTNIRSGVFPTAITVEFDVPIMDNTGPLEYGWQPDGSAINWDNSTRDKRRVRIKSVSFISEVLKPAPAPDTLEAAETTQQPVLVQSANALPNPDLKSLLGTVVDINKNLSRLIKVLIVIVATALGVSYKHW
ncbi:MAG: hypothetical protein ING69_10720 [Rhodocyclaceae bacterium]|nr:hypothetical protein [Rhodocyclaceae bacterium]